MSEESINSNNRIAVEEPTEGVRQITVPKAWLIEQLEHLIEDGEVIVATRGTVENGVQVDLVDGQKLLDRHRERLRKAGLEGRI